MSSFVLYPEGKQTNAHTTFHLSLSDEKVVTSKLIALPLSTVSMHMVQISNIYLC